MFLLLALLLLAGQVSPGQPAVQEALAQARTLLDHGQSAEAIGTLEKIRLSDPAAKGIDHLLGLAYYRKGRLMAAQQAFTRAIAADSSDLESVQLLGLTLYRLGKPADAIPYLEQVKQWLPEANADATHVLGLCYMNAQQFDKAREAFADEFHVPVDSASAYLVLARLLMVANLTGEASTAASAALKRSPRIPLAHFYLGEAALYTSDLGRAAAEFEAERNLNPGYPAVYERLGDIDFRLGHYAEAEQLLLKSIELDTSRTGSFLLMGQVLLRRGQLRESAMYFEHAKSMDPSNRLVHTQLAQVYRRLGDAQKAQAELDAANKLYTARQLQLEDVH